MEMHLAPPDLGLHHAIGAARSGSRAVTWFAVISMAHPGAVAGVLWVIYGVLRAPELATMFAVEKTDRLIRDNAGAVVQAIPTYQPRIDRGPATVNIAAGWVAFGAGVLTIAAMATLLLSVLSRPTHQYVDGHLRPVRGHTSFRRRRQGAYVRLKGVKEGVEGDMRQGKADVMKAKRARKKVQGWREAREASIALAAVWAAEEAALPPPPPDAPEAPVPAVQLADPAAPMVAPASFGAYASDPELVDAGVLHRAEADHRAAVVADPYASPAEQQEALT